MTGIEKDPLVIKEATARLNGASPFASGPAQLAVRSPMTYAKEIMETLHRYPEGFMRSAHLVRLDVSDPSVLEPFRDADLVLVNNVLIYMDAKEKLLSFLDQAFPGAFLAFEQKYKFSTFRHRWEADVPGVLGYWFGLPRLGPSPHSAQSLAQSA
jgi:hypothetical protein